jgi:alkylation response protein AidB-like acyl-CoA dehydrogenase
LENIVDFNLTEEQDLILASIREMMERDFTEEYFRKCDESYTYPLEFMKALADNGITMLGVPEEFGGTPADVMTQMLAIEEVGRMGGPAFLMSASHNIHNMLNFGNKEQLQKTVDVISDSGIPAYALAITEPQAGSDNNMLATTYTRRNGKVYLNGQKTFITGAADYPYMLVVARDPNGSDPKRCFSMWWVDPKSKGVRLNRLHKVGWRMVSNCEVFLDDVELEESALVGQEGNGFLHLMKNFEIERLTIAAYSLGPAECAFEDAARYANQRITFGKTIGSYQLIQEKLTNMAIKIQNMKNYVYRVAWEEDNHMSLRLSSAMCKLYCSRVAQEVIDDAMQVMGGVGYTDDCRIGRLWRDIRESRIGGGTDEIMIHIAGRQIVKQYAK